MVERIHGKDEVASSILADGSRKHGEFFVLSARIERRRHAIGPSAESGQEPPHIFESEGRRKYVGELTPILADGSRKRG